ncbi:MULTISPECIES: ABC transporter substrate-binding protein [unclassified Granulicatella]|uniref:ABC transporter substrate-binding protein n=1 Tax=unclassified Granulicatella TaxID=2630493 RepID=UPI0010744E14|nr:MULTISPECIES: ABC transporter substrate-binding protein [unclassified Granulicatella]MBF0779743.1 ABC transporter substrate-binding protein [Granulicatella sp. 19428wC4_WM01]TFU96262.1 iron ABC transporter substrate-binding protein [Granulicatella sp. WM01]
MHNMKKLISMTSAVLLLFACQANTTTQRKDASQIKQENSAQSGVNSASISEHKTVYPLTIQTYGSNGEAISTVYQKAPEKVVAVYQGSIETLLALGLEDRIVAASGLDNEVPDNQKAAFSKINYLDSFTPSLEEVTLLNPDMIFSWGSLFSEKTLGNTQDWIDKGTNTYINTNTKRGTDVARTLENEYTDILNIGKIFDVQSKSERMVNQMKSTIEKVIEKTKNINEKPKTLIIEPTGEGILNYGKNTLGGDMITQLGGQLSNPDGAQLGKEDIIKANPDVIFVVYMPYAGDNAEEVKQKSLDAVLNDDAFSSLNALKNKRVVPIILSEMFASATRTHDGIIHFAQGLYPTTDLDLE